MGSKASWKYRPVRTPTVLQMEAAECGAAALAIILEYHGRYVPLDVLRDDCGVSRDGSNALYIRQAAKRYGLEVRAFRKPADGLFNRQPPFIVFWEWNHFLVVEGLRRGRVCLNDPASGRRTIDFDEFARGYSEIAFTFEPGPQFQKKGKRPSALLGLLRRLSTSKTALLFVILAGLALVIPNLVSAAFQRVFIDEILIQGHREWLKPLLWAMALTAALRLAAAALEQVYLTRLEIRLTLVESIEFMWHVLRLPMAFFQHRWTGDLVSRALSTSRVARLISGELATTTVSLLTLVVYVGVLLPRDPLLATVGVGISSLNLVAIQWLSRWRADRNRAIEQIRARLLASVMWAIQIVESIKAAGAESDMFVRWSGEQARLISAEQALGFWNTVLVTLPTFLASLTAVAVLGLGGHEVIFGSLSIGVLVAIQALLANFNQPFQDLARLGTDVQELRADLDRIDDVRNQPLDEVFAARDRSPVLSRRTTPVEDVASQARRLSGHLEFRQVTFGYNRTVEEPLIKDFSFVACPGQRIALVGSSGSGKSTIGRLAAGLYRPWEGDVLYDGKPLSELPRDVFVNSVALVDAEICLFEGSVRENLTLWDDMVPTERLIRASVDAAIHGDVLQRRGGYSAPVAEAARNFSGGQRQRLQIARALVRDPSLVILDEATSALDPRTETIVDDNLRRRGCTCLIIAHRLTTIRDCDLIIVLSGGRVVQRGTHDELFAATDGEYARLVSHQALPGPRSGRFSPMRSPAKAQSTVPFWGDSSAEAAGWDLSAQEPPNLLPDQQSAAARFIVEELLPFSRPEQTAANRPLALDDPGAVWWVSSGSVDVFFTQLEPGTIGGRRHHLCRVDEGGSIFALSGVRGRSAGGLLAVGAGPAQLLKFARGDLIRLSFDEGLSDQVAVLIDDWVIRVGRALSRWARARRRFELAGSVVVELEPDVRFGTREGVAWVRHLRGTSIFLDRVPLPAGELQARFPVTEHLWLTTATACRVIACDTRALIRTGDPWASLDNFHRAILDFSWETHEQETIARWVELKRSGAHEAAVFESVSSRLAAAINKAAPRAVDSDGDALLTACRAVGQHLGIEVRPAPLIGQAGLDNSSEPLLDLARAGGFQVRPVALDRYWWRRRRGDPYLGRLRDQGQTPVALVPARSRTGWFGPAYELLDSEGPRPVGRELAGRIAPTAWMLYRALPDNPLKKSDLLRFALHVRGLGRELLTVLAMALCGAILGLSIPIASGIIVDQVLPAADFGQLTLLCLFLIVITSAVAIFQAIQGLVVLRIEGRVSASLVPAFWDRLLRLPSRFFARFSSGDLAMRAMEPSEIFQKISGAVVATVVTGLFSFFNLALLFFYSWKMACCAAAMLAVLLCVTALLLAGLLRYESSIRAIDGSISGLLLELYGGIGPLRTAGAEGRAFSRWTRHYTERLALAIRARRFSSGIHQWLAVYPILTAMVVYTGSIHLDPGLMKTGSFLSFNIAFANLMGAVLAVGYTSIGLLELLPRYERIRPILEENPEFAAAVAEPVRLTGALALNHVSFRYPGQEKGAKVLGDVSLQVRPGEFVAIVGPSGSGKSTLMRLLLGFEAPDSGTVTYDGRELATLDPREVRRQIGVVLQHAQLMPSDIYSNIVGFAPHLTIDDAWRAARLAGLEDDIRRMPMGMHTLIGEGGGNLSSGQQQRLLIARAIVRGPKILLLDEATSALDNVTQALVSDNIANQLKGVTRVVIAHRLDAIIGADRIYVVKDGQIVQSGQYQQLLEEPGPFRDLARRQIV